MTANEQPFLLGIDLEESGAGSGQQTADGKVPALTERYLDFFARHGGHATFFTVGETARRYPSLIRELVSAGHEVACHTDRHIPIDRLDATTLADELARWRESVAGADVGETLGFRAPVLSMTAATTWAYAVLHRHGFVYSSSVLPAPNPLFGWPGFGAAPRAMDGVLEIPVTTLDLPKLHVPYAAGVYLRNLPGWLVTRSAAGQRRRGLPLVGYLHPYDLDTDEADTDYPFLNGKPFYRWLMFRNRHTVLGKLEGIMRAGFKIETYAAFWRRHTGRG